MAQIQYVLFDMDGLLIDTELIYTKVTNTILAPYNKEMTWDIKAGCMGKPELPATLYLLSFFPDIPITPAEFIEQRNKLQDSFWPTTALLPGAEKLLLHLQRHNIPICLATSSRRRGFALKTGHLGHMFGEQGVFAVTRENGEKGFNIVCGDDLTGEPPAPIKGKPSPDIFLTAARDKLGRDVGFGDVLSAPEGISDAQKVARSKGLVFEDSLPGVEAGKRAGMHVVWVPDSNLLALSKDAPLPDAPKADSMLASLEAFVPEQWGLPPYDG
ncbi:hypothetical protein MKEN_00100100 [Mycena kentingensis (nom. inval.)]|nr:hypothetical protein MKEN_00100100 [Mycena kentingensis (nom. inval.)]